jgi:transposase-like protein
MTKTRRTYTRQFKLEAVRLSQTSQGAAQIEGDLGIGCCCLYRWKWKLAEEGENGRALLHRVVLQPASPSLGAGLSQPGGL